MILLWLSQELWVSISECLTALSPNDRYICPLYFRSNQILKHATVGRQIVYIFFLSWWNCSFIQIIYEINFRFLEELKKRIGLDYDRLSRMSIIEEGAVKVFVISIQNFLFSTVFFSCLILRSKSGIRKWGVLDGNVIW